MTKEKELLPYLVLKECFGAFVEYGFSVLHNQKLELNWHHKMMIAGLEECRTGKLDRLVVNVPPRNLKSEIISIMYPVWYLGKLGGGMRREIIIITQNKKLGQIFLEQIKVLLDNEIIQMIFPSVMVIKTKTDKIQTTKGSIAIYTPRTPIIGTGGDIFIIDDPMTIRDAKNIEKIRELNKWFSEELLTRMNDRDKGQIILAMQRINSFDLSGYLVNRRDKCDKTKHINIPALAKSTEIHTWQEWSVLAQKFITKTYTREEAELINPVRDSFETLSTLKKQMGNAAFECQYQQKPEGDLDIITDFETLTEIPSIKKGRLVINCIVSDEKLVGVVSLSNFNNRKNVYVMEYFKDNIRKSLEDKLIELVKEYRNNIQSEYVNYKKKGELQVVVICQNIKDKKHLVKELEKYDKTSDFRYLYYVENKKLIADEKYQEALEHLFTDNTFENTTIFIYNPDFEKQLKSDLSQYETGECFRLLVENIAVQQSK